MQIPETLKPVVEQFPEITERLQVATEKWTLDVRDMMPPEPMELTLAVLDYLPKGVSLLQINQRVPRFLLPLLEERNMKAQVLQEKENDVHIEIQYI